MAGEQYAEKAVKATVDYYEAQLQTHLTAVEAALSLAAGALPPPCDYVGADVERDLRSPLLEVWSSTGDAEDAINGVWTFDVTVAMTFVGDANAEAGQLKARRYLSAMIRTVKASRTFGGQVMSVIEERCSLAETRGDQSQIRHAAVLDLKVWLHEA